MLEQSKPEKKKLTVEEAIGKHIDSLPESERAEQLEQLAEMFPKQEGPDEAE